MPTNRKCRMCKGKQFELVLNMGDNPTVNSLIEEKDLSNEEAVYPLVVEQCQTCWLVQIVEPVDAQKIYRDEDYLYFSGDMPGLSSYFLEYAAEVKSNIFQGQDLADKFIIEIGSNDGTMLHHFKNWNADILGVDPASNVVVRALRDGIPTVSDFFSSRIAKSIFRDFGRADFIYGNNCIAHLKDLNDLMEGVKILLKNDGVFAVECNYWGGMVKNKNYALVYHDHYSYFSLTNWANFADEHGMKVFDAWVTPAQGGSLRVYMTRDLKRAVTDRCSTLLHEEVTIHLSSLETARKYRTSVLAEAKKLFSLIGEIKKTGKTIAGYGAAAKGFSVLKLAGLDQRHIDYFVDDSPAKQGKYTPVTHIPVVSREIAEGNLPDYFFITAPNYEKVIVEKEVNFRENGGKFITVDCRIL